MTDDETDRDAPATRRAFSEAERELRAREPIFHRPELGTTRRDFEAMTDPEFWEVGASGRCYDRAFVLDTLEQRHAQPVDERWEVSDFRCREIAVGHYLVTYVLVQDGRRVTRRATLWRHGDAGWTILYHQGTLVEGDPT